MAKSPQLSQEERQALGLTVEADIEGLGEVRCKKRDLFDRSLIRQTAPLRVSFGLRVALDCPACHGSIPIGQLAGQATCPHCQKPTSLDDDFWTVVFDPQSMASAFCASSGVGYSTSAMGSDYGDFEYWCRRNPPYCHACRTPLPAGLVDRAVVGEPIACPSCERPVPARPAGDLEESICPGALVVLGEMGGDEATEPMATAEIRCQECGADLALDGTARTVTCKFCQASNLIPDAVWEQLHPAPVVREFYLIADVMDALRWLWILDDEERMDRIKLAEIDFSEQALELFAEHERYEVREIPAAREQTPVEVLEQLSRDTHGHVQELVAANPSAPPRTLEALVQQNRAREQVAANPRIASLSDEALLTLLQDNGRSIHQAIIRNSCFPLARLARDAMSFGSKARETLAYRAGELPPEMVMQLVADADRDVQKALAQNPQTGPEPLARLAKSDDSDVRLAVARNPNTANKTIRKLSCDSDNEIRRAAEKHPHWSKPSLWDRL